MTDAKTKPGRPAPRLDFTGLEWKLAITAALAGAYAALWVAIRPARTEGAASSDAVEAAPATNPVWLEQLPAERRPAVEPPRGFQLASAPRLAIEPRTQPAPRRATRVRTRSS